MASQRKHAAGHTARVGTCADRRQAGAKVPLSGRKRAMKNGTSKDEFTHRIAACFEMVDQLQALGKPVLNAAEQACHLIADDDDQEAVEKGRGTLDQNIRSLNSIVKCINDTVQLADRLGGALTSAEERANASARSAPDHDRPAPDLGSLEAAALGYLRACSAGDESAGTQSTEE